MFVGLELLIGIIISAFVAYVAYYAGRQSGAEYMRNELTAEHADNLDQLETAREESEKKLNDAIENLSEEQKKEQEAYAKMQKEWEKKDYTREEIASKAISAWRSVRAGMSQLDDHHHIYRNAIQNQFEAWQTKTAKTDSEPDSDKSE